ncbi:MAG: 2-dehydropantoate 2-reductase [Novosphingobium aromaticivorans]|nr:2-dehydropantoate 2-reductase [Novosphingobium aromaticivorans]
MMRFAIVGAGAIGCALAARLAHAGADVTLVVRDPARAALIAGQGIACREGAVSYVARPRVARTVPDGGVDVLVMAVKAGDLPAVAASLPQGIGPQTLVMPLVNGIPWWLAGAGGETIQAVDPDGILQRRFLPEQVVGSVVYTTATVEGPAAVRVTGGQKLVLGALCPDRTAAVAALAQRLRAYGIEIEVSDTIVDAVWNKVALNLATNPLSVVTGAPLGQLCSDERLEPIVSNILDEAWRVAARYNARPPMTREDMLNRGRAAGAHRTSMLEDYRKGRPLELSAIADAVFELAARVGMDLPVSRAVVDMARFQTMPPVA